jgi:hypothetical protein
MKSFDPGTFFTLLPGVMPEAGAYEQAEEKRENLRFNKAADHLRRRIRESGGRDRDAEHLLAELQFGDGSDWRPSHGPDRF